MIEHVDAGDALKIRLSRVLNVMNLSRSSDSRRFEGWLMWTLFQSRSQMTWRLNDQHAVTLGDGDFSLCASVEFEEIHFHAIAENYAPLRHVRFESKRVLC